MADTAYKKKKAKALQLRKGRKRSPVSTISVRAATPDCEAEDSDSSSDDFSGAEEAPDSSETKNLPAPGTALTFTEEEKLSWSHQDICSGAEMEHLEVLFDQPGPLGLVLLQNLRTGQCGLSGCSGAAAQQGARAGDIIVRVGDTDMSQANPEKIKAAIASAGRPFKMSFQRPRLTASKPPPPQYDIPVPAAADAKKQDYQTVPNSTKGKVTEGRASSGLDNAADKAGEGKEKDGEDKEKDTEAWTVEQTALLPLEGVPRWKQAQKQGLRSL